MMNDKEAKELSGHDKLIDLIGEALTILSNKNEDEDQFNWDHDHATLAGNFEKRIDEAASYLRKALDAYYYAEE